MDWKVWKEIDIGTELEEYNKKLETEVAPIPDVVMGDAPTSEPEMKIEEKVVENTDSNVEMKANEHTEEPKEEKVLENDQQVSPTEPQPATEAIVPPPVPAPEPIPEFNLNSA